MSELPTVIITVGSSLITPSLGCCALIGQRSVRVRFSHVATTPRGYRHPSSPFRNLSTLYARKLVKLSFPVDHPPIVCVTALSQDSNGGRRSDSKSAGHHPPWCARTASATSRCNVGALRLRYSPQELRQKRSSIVGARQCSARACATRGFVLVVYPLRFSDRN